MITSTTMLARDLAYVLADTTFRSTLTYGTVSVAGTAGEETREKDIMAEGEQYIYRRTWAGLVSAFTGGLPDVQQAVSIGGVTYRVEGRETSPDNLAVTLALKRNKKL